MKHPKWMAILAVITALSLAALACGGGGAAATDTPEPTKAPAATRTPKPTEETTPTDEPQPTKEVIEPTGEGLEIVNHRSYIDNYGYVHVVGLIRNNTADPVTNISLELTLTDANGDTILREGEDPVDTAEGYTALYTVSPDNETPFDYWTFVPEGMEAAEYTVEIVSYDEGNVDRGELDIQNAQMIFDSDGNAYFSGELVNLTDQPVLVNSFAGAALDADGNVLAADYTFSMNRYLYPAGSENDYDRTPFLVTLDGPVADETDSWSAYWDADIADEQDGLGIDLEVTNTFYDDFGNLHLVGLATNNSNNPLYVSLVAGLYAADGTVLDAATSSVPVYVQPDSSAPFQFQYFSSVNYNEDQADLVDTYTVRVDRYWSYEPSFETVELESTEEMTTEGSGVWNAVGEVTNSSDQDLSSIVIIVAVFDENDNLVGMDWTSMYPDGEAYAPGDTAEFDFSVYLDPEVDSSNFQYQTYVQGYVK